MQGQLRCRQGLCFRTCSSKERLPCRTPTQAAVLPRVSTPGAMHVPPQVQQHQRQRYCLHQMYEQQPRLVCKASSSSSSSGSSPKPSGSLWPWFDRLPPKVQLGIMGGLLFVGMFVIPFLQPTFLYGDSSSSSSKTAAQPQITNVKGSTPSSSEQRLYKLPCYIPGASELYDFLQENAMPRKLPDGRSESPGVLRIYLSSMIILALFYVCSGVVGLILRSVAAVLRAAKIVGPPKPDGQ